jgi:hypothetical protein
MIAFSLPACKHRPHLTLELAQSEKVEAALLSNITDYDTIHNKDAANQCRLQLVQQRMYTDSLRKQLESLT